MPYVTVGKSGDAVEEISSNLRRLLADVFALYVKTIKKPTIRKVQ